jgi:hypothetical protein
VRWRWKQIHTIQQHCKLWTRMYRPRFNNIEWSQSVTRLQGEQSSKIQNLIFAVSQGSQTTPPKQLCIKLPTFSCFSFFKINVLQWPDHIALSHLWATAYCRWTADYGAASIGVPPCSSIETFWKLQPPPQYIVQTLARCWVWTWIFRVERYPCIGHR